MQPEFVPHIRAASDLVLKQYQQIDLFFDAHLMTGFERSFRAQMTDWHEQLRRPTRYAGVLVRSKVVKMAISIVTTATGGKIVGHEIRANFEAALTRAITQPIEAVRPSSWATV